MDISHVLVPPVVLVWSSKHQLLGCPSRGLLVDTLMDPVLTSTMLAELKPATGATQGGNPRDQLLTS